MTAGHAYTRPRQATPRVLALHALPLTRTRLRRMVDTADDLIWLGAMDSLRMAAPAIAGLQPDVVVLQSSLDPDGSFATHLKSTYPSLVLVVLADERDTRWRGRTGHTVLSPTDTSAALLGAMRQAFTISPAARTPKPGTLTSRQRQILGLIAEGNETLAISHRLEISPETVRSHVKEILRRLAANDRAHAVAIGFRTGILDDVPFRS